MGCVINLSSHHSTTLRMHSILVPRHLSIEIFDSLGMRLDELVLRIRLASSLT